MKYIIREDVGTVYWLDGGTLMFTPLCKDGTFETDNGGEVDKVLMQGEKTSEGKLFEDIYKTVEYKLTKRN